MKGSDAMSRQRWSRTAPWLGLAGSAVLAAGLFMAPGIEIREPDRAAVKVSRQQVADAVEATVTETPSLSSELDKLTKEMRESSLAQSLFVAEAFSQGLAESDYIVRNRLVEMQVMSIYERADTAVTPGAGAAHFAEHRDRYARPARRKILHLFVPVTNRLGEDEARARLEERLRDESARGEAAWMEETDLRTTYGPGLARRVFEMPPGEWRGPIRSSLGWHAVLVEDEEMERPYELDEVRTRVTEDLRRELRQKAYREELERLKGKYRVEWVE